MWTAAILNIRIEYMWVPNVIYFMLYFFNDFHKLQVPKHAIFRGTTRGSYFDRTAVFSCIFIKKQQKVALSGSRTYDHIHVIRQILSELEYIHHTQSAIQATDYLRLMFVSK
ncbi:Hypothetical_protein [Hexamita inflata]|uniref:Hypothetical_protein n=1 Tax=Hexamita inflata TaxID=28002 RepID=A0AA86TR16_9EUKA|nr:Hypothetical protein HINF_LOCUS13126 [Hexamita inflata]